MHGAAVRETRRQRYAISPRDLATPFTFAGRLLAGSRLTDGVITPKPATGAGADRDRHNL